MLDLYKALNVWFIDHFIIDIFWGLILGVLAISLGRFFYSIKHKENALLKEYKGTVRRFDLACIEMLERKYNLTAENPHENPFELKLKEEGYYTDPSPKKDKQKKEEEGDRLEEELLATLKKDFE